MNVTAGGTRPRQLAALAAPAGVLLGASAGLAVLALVDPNEPGHYPTCPFLALTGRWCPGCGSLRSLHALTEGDVPAAAGLNLLTLLAIPLLAVVWWRWTSRRWSGTPRSSPAPAGWLWAAAVLVVAFAVVRNLPVGSALAP